MSILEVTNLKKSFGKNEVLKGISLSLEEGQVMSVIGSSGSGKTTLLRCINFLETADSGKIMVDGDVIFDGEDKTVRKAKEIREKQLKIGLVFQQFNLFPQYNVLDNVTLAVKLKAKERPDYKQNKKQILKEIDEKALKLLNDMGLSDKIDHYPCELSGGQQQRVSIGRALINNPAVMLADEPTGNLDSKNSHEILELLKLSHKKYGQTLIVITHDSNIALQADRIITINDGKIASDRLLQK